MAEKSIGTALPETPGHSGTRHSCSTGFITFDCQAARVQPVLTRPTGTAMLVFAILNRLPRRNSAHSVTQPHAHAHAPLGQLEPTPRLVRVASLARLLRSSPFTDALLLSFSALSCYQSTRCGTPTTIGERGVPQPGPPSLPEADPSVLPRRTLPPLAIQATRATMIATTRCPEGRGPIRSQSSLAAIPTKTNTKSAPSCHS